MPPGGRGRGRPRKESPAPPGKKRALKQKEDPHQHRKKSAKRDTSPSPQQSSSFGRQRKPTKRFSIDGDEENVSPLSAPPLTAGRGRGRGKKITMAAVLPPEMAAAGAAAKAKTLKEEKAREKAEKEREKIEKKENERVRKQLEKERKEREKEVKLRLQLQKKINKGGRPRKQQAAPSPKHPSLQLDRLVSNPKTVAERRNNAKILTNFNQGHSDDIFGAAPGAASSLSPIRLLPQATKKSAKTVGAGGILNELFDSDSENDLSIHSSRTPIGRYLERSRTTTPMRDDVREERVDEDEDGDEDGERDEERDRQQTG
jgi:hypothetical protein